MKIVVLESKHVNPGDLSWDEVAKLGELVVYESTDFFDEDLIASRIGDADIVMFNEVPISRRTIDRCPNLKLIAMLATGYNSVDYTYAREKGILVANVPTYGTEPVAQYTLAMLMELCSHIGYHNEMLHNRARQGIAKPFQWDLPLTELNGKTIGIIGFGRIGQTVGRMAKGFGMRVLAFDKFPNDSGRAIGEYVDLDTLLHEAHVISLNCPLFPENHEIIRKENIDKMRDGVFLVNTARGQLIREQDLADALNSGKVKGAGLDVTAVEPVQPDNPLLEAKNCIITPHIAWMPVECRQRMLTAATENIRAFLAGKPTNVVN